MELKGIYRIYQNGELVAVQPNLITTVGKRIILSYLAGHIGSYAGAIGIGTDGTAATTADDKLGFEFARANVVGTIPNSSAGTVTVRASFDSLVSGVIHELGVFPFLGQTNTEYGNQILSSFEPSVEELTGGSTDTVSFRIGSEGYRINATANGNTTANILQLVKDFSGNSPTDVFSLSYFTADANASTIRVRLKQDNANYFEYTIDAADVAGYNVAEWYKAAFVATGVPAWDSITSADITVFAKAAGATAVVLDGLRVDSVNPAIDQGLVSRSTLAIPRVKVAGEPLDIEYTIGFDIT